jgi:hypothetical protein
MRARRAIIYRDCARQDGPDIVVAVVLWKSGKEALGTFGKMALAAQG